MDVINKFYSTVQTTVSQLSGVLPGNNVTREYEILHQVASAGIGLHWKVYSGFKKTTKQEVSIFVFEKKILEKLSKEDRDSLLHLLRRGVQQLTKIKHPRIVTVQHPLEESRDSLAFATEPVIASLSNILEDASTTKLFDVEIIHGFQQLIDGLMFLHCDANIVHGNLSTESVLINKLRNWKIFGLDFSATKHSQNNKFRGLNALSNLLVYPIFEYLAPEKLSSEINIPESDVYSLGMLMYCVCCGRPLMGFDKNHSFKQMSLQPAQLKDADMDKVPHDLRNILKSMLHHKPNSRPKLNELIQLPPFQYIGVKTLNYLDTLYQWNNLEKSKFFKSLLQIIPSFPHQVNIHTVMPHLLNEFANLAMVPFVLPNVLLIAKTSSQEEYSIHILPHIKSAFGIDEPIQVLLILMQELDILLKLTPDSQVKLYILPLLKKSLESDITELQELCLRRLPTLSSLVLDQNSIKNSLIPRIKNLCIKSTDVSIKVKCLICIGKLLEHLDKGVLLSDVLPFFEHIKNREPAIIMAIIGIHRIALNDSKFGITAEIMATKCIPYITPLCMENNLSVAQFTSIATMIKEMFQKIEEEQLIKLEQINTINRDSRIPCNQRSTALSLPGSSCKLLLPSRSALENEKGSILEAKNHTNPLVINRLLMTPAMKALETTHEDYANPNPSINYIYTSHSSLLDHQNVSTQISTANNTKQSNAENSKLIPLTQQDILNFLKIPCNQRSTALSLPGSNCKLLLPSRSALENEKGSILEAKNHTNPLVINRLLMTPAMKALETTHEDYANPNPSINYIYTSHSSLLDHQNVSTQISTANNTKQSNAENSKLIPLTQQDILNFLKIPCNQRSTALSLPGSNCKLLLPSRSALENEKGSILEAKNHTNPLVINRLLMTPAMKALETTHEDYANPNPSINYIYTSHSSLLDHQNVSTQISTANNTKQSNAENSKLIPLTQQDILNFLK